MKQSKKQSLAESIANTVIGLATSFFIQIAVYPFLGINVSLKTNAKITVIFFLVSIVRSYFVRRLFNKIKP